MGKIFRNYIIKKWLDLESVTGKEKKDTWVDKKLNGWFIGNLTDQQTTEIQTTLVVIRGKLNPPRAIALYRSSQC